MKQNEKITFLSLQKCVTELQDIKQLRWPDILYKIAFLIMGLSIFSIIFWWRW